MYRHEVYVIFESDILLFWKSFEWSILQLSNEEKQVPLMVYNIRDDILTGI